MSRRGRGPHADDRTRRRSRVQRTRSQCAIYERAVVKAEQVFSKYRIKKEDKGCVVEQMMPGGPADKAGIQTGDVVRVVLLFYLMPAWALLLAWPLLGERPGPSALFRLALALTGVLVVLKTPESPWPVPEQLADWLALLGGFCFALTNVLLRRLQHTPSDARTLAMFLGGAFMATVAAAGGMQMGIVGAPPAPHAGWTVLAMALGLAMLLGNLALQYGAARLPASTTSIIMLTEVVFASISSVLLGTGVLTLTTALGGALILLAAVLAAL